MGRPARSTVAGQVYNDLRNLARHEGRSTDQIMIEYVLERFLYRMSHSPLEGSCFILKGASAQLSRHRSATAAPGVLSRLASSARK